MFALAGHNALPAVRKILTSQEKDLPYVILIAYGLVFVVYLTFMYVVVGVTGNNTTEIATIALGSAIGPVMIVLGNVLAIFTISTCYLSNGLALRRTFEYDYKKPRKVATILAMSIPLILFAFGARNFIVILGLVGGLILGIQCSIIIFTYWKAHHHGDRQPEFTHAPLYIAGAALLLLFIFGALATLTNQL